MIEQHWAYVAFGVLAILILASSRSTGHRPIPTMAFQLLFAFYLTRLFALTFLPFPIDARVIAEERQLAALGVGGNNNFVPFALLRDTWGWTFTRQVLGNLVLLFPLGVLGPLALRRLRTWRAMAPVLVITPLGIEVAQLLGSRALGFTYRSFDVDDIWLNALGGFAGACVSLVFLTKAKSYETVPSEAGDSRAASASAERTRVLPCRHRTNSDSHHR